MVFNLNTTADFCGASPSNGTGVASPCALESAQAGLHAVFVLAVFQYVLTLLAHDEAPAATGTGSPGSPRARPRAPVDTANTFRTPDALRLGLAAAAVTNWLVAILVRGLSSMPHGFLPYHTLLMVASAVAWGPSSPSRVPVFAARALNVKGQSRVTLSLQQKHLKSSLCAMTGGNETSLTFAPTTTLAGGAWQGEAPKCMERCPAISLPPPRIMDEDKCSLGFVPKGSSPPLPLHRPLLPNFLVLACLREPSKSGALKGGC